MPSIVCGIVVAGRAHAAEPHIDTAPRPFGARAQLRLRPMNTSSTYSPARKNSSGSTPSTTKPSDS